MAAALAASAVVWLTLLTVSALIRCEMPLKTAADFSDRETTDSEDGVEEGEADDEGGEVEEDCEEDEEAEGVKEVDMTMGCASIVSYRSVSGTTGRTNIAAADICWQLY